MCLRIYHRLKHLNYYIFLNPIIYQANTKNVFIQVNKNSPYCTSFFSGKCSSAVHVRNAKNCNNYFLHLQNPQNKFPSSPNNSHNVNENSSRWLFLAAMPRSCSYWNWVIFYWICPGKLYIGKFLVHEYSKIIYFNVLASSLLASTWTCWIICW